MPIDELNTLAMQAEDAAQSLYCILESFNLPEHQERPALFVAGSLGGVVRKLLAEIEARKEIELNDRQAKAV